MTTRRTFLSLTAAGAAGLWLARDRLPWTGPAVRLAAGGTPWLPIPNRDGLIEIDVQVGGAPLRALVDSGAQMSAIDRVAAERLGLPPRIAAPVMAYGVTGAPTLAHTVTLDLTLPGLAVPSLPAAALALDAIVQAADRDFQLILGRDVLRSVVLEADFLRDRMRFLPLDQRRRPRDALLIPLASIGGAPTVAVQVEAAAPVQVLVDTGSSGVLALSERAARQVGLLRPGRRIETAPSLGLGGLSLDRRVMADSLRLGGVTLRDVPVHIYPDRRGRGALEGLLGAGLLRRFHVTLDLARDRLLLTRPGLAIVSPDLEPRR